jgi:hypothetical protein
MGIWMGPDNISSLRQTLCGLILTQGVDHLGPPLPLRLSLPGHGPLHPDGQFYVLDLYHRHFDALGFRLFANDAPEPLVDFLKVSLPPGRSLLAL